MSCFFSTLVSLVSQLFMTTDLHGFPIQNFSIFNLNISSNLYDVIPIIVYMLFSYNIWICCPISSYELFYGLFVYICSYTVLILYQTANIIKKERKKESFKDWGRAFPCRTWRWPYSMHPIMIISLKKI